MLCGVDALAGLPVAAEMGEEVEHLAGHLRRGPMGHVHLRHNPNPGHAVLTLQIGDVIGNAIGHNGSAAVLCQRQNRKKKTNLSGGGKIAAPQLVKKASQSLAA